MSDPPSSSSAHGARPLHTPAHRPPDRTSGLHESDFRARPSRRSAASGRPAGGHAAWLAARQARVPRQLVFDETLPVNQRRDELMTAIRDHPVVVVCGETGSGKTTQLPKICLALGRGVAGMIGHTQPRRIAARAVAQRLRVECAPLRGSIPVPESPSPKEHMFRQKTGQKPDQKAAASAASLAAREGLSGQEVSFPGVSQGQFREKLQEQSQETVAVAQEARAELVGYRMRFEENASPHDLIRLMTDGILLAETQSDPDLRQYDTIIIDEAHERSLNIDFLLGYLHRLLPRRPDLKLIITSATIDAERFAAHFSTPTHPVPVLEISGRTYPVEVRYRPLVAQDDDDAELEMEAEIAQTVEDLWRRDGPGDVLVFLPGEREIRETADPLRRLHWPGIEVLPLYARLSAAEQQRIFRRGNGYRVVLATNIAETSLTVPGIRYVIDTGLARIKRYAPRAGVDQLGIEKISQAAAQQRAGRCGRVSAGVCVRLYDEADFSTRPAFTDPEIVRTSLAATLLHMQALQLGPVVEFPFLDPPSSRLVAHGYAHLQELGALDADGRLTPCGQQLARLPVDPKLGRMLQAGREENCLTEMLILVAGLSVRDPRERPLTAREAADRAHARHTDERSDFMSLLALWQYADAHLFGGGTSGGGASGEGVSGGKALSQRKAVAFCHDNFLGYLRLREWRELHHQLHREIERMGWLRAPATHRPGPHASGSSASESQGNKTHSVRDAKRAQGEKSLPDAGHSTDAGRDLAAQQHQGRRAEKLRIAQEAQRYAAIHRALCAGLLGNIGMKLEAAAARKTPHAREGEDYLGAHGIRFAIFPGSALFKKARKTASGLSAALAESAAARNAPGALSAKWVVAAELVETSKLYARGVAAIEPQWLEQLAAHRVRREYFDPHWDEARGEVSASERVLLYGLPLVARRTVPYGRIAPALARETMLRDGLAARQFLPPAARQRHPYCNAFWQHNEALLEQLESREHKMRRQDVRVDSDTLFSFYDARIPSTIHSRALLEAWLAAAEPSRQMLCLSESDLPDDQAEELENRYPEKLWVRADASAQAAILPLALDYHFSPGHPLDGVCATLPLAVLHTVDAAAFDWLVPGLLREKLTLLMKSLPKAIRHACVPLPAFITALLTDLEAAGQLPRYPVRDIAQRDTQEAPVVNYPPLLRTLAQAIAVRIRIHSGAKLAVHEEDFQSDALPVHLRMRLRVVDAAGKELAEARDLDRLRQQFPLAAPLTAVEPVSKSAHGTRRPAAGDMQTTRRPAAELPTVSHASAARASSARLWEFGTLPEIVQVERQGFVLATYPALCLLEEGSACTLHSFERADIAQTAHRAAVRTLLCWALAPQIKQLPTLPPALILSFRTLTSGEALTGDLLAGVCDRALLGEDPVPRDEPSFEQQKQRARARLRVVYDSALRVLQEITTQLPLLQAVLTSTASRGGGARTVVPPMPAPLRNALQVQFRQLLAPGFIARTPWEEYTQLPRYLCAMAMRIEKYNPGSAAREVQHEAALAALWQRWEAERARRETLCETTGPGWEALCEFRWQLEELRISLFAQSLRTRYPVSFKRLEKIWGEVMALE